jgi:hypothetical protein
MRGLKKFRQSCPEKTLNNIGFMGRQVITLSHVPGAGPEHYKNSKSFESTRLKLSPLYLSVCLNF